MMGRAGGLTNLEAQNQGYELVHPNVHPIYELLEHMKGQVLQI